jgi:hypothetical protein
MAREIHTLGVGESPELARLAGRVRASKRPLFLKEEGETVAVLMPVGPPASRRRRERTQADRRAFPSAAGAWKGHVDADRLLKDNAESRRISSGPASVLRSTWWTPTG